MDEQAKPRRTERQASTKASLLASAEKLIMENGWGDLSLEGVAKAAGYTRGAFYSNFEDKEDLLISVTEYIFEAQIASIQELDPERDAKTWLEIFPRYGPWFVLGLETWLLAQRNEKVHARLARLFQRLRKRLAWFLGLLARLRGAPLPLGPEEMSAAMVALRIGLMMQKRLEPQAVPDGTYDKVLKLLLRPNNNT